LLGFELSFPASCEFHETLGTGELKESGKTLFRTDAWPADECMHAPADSILVALTELALKRAKDFCQADGCNGSSYCTDPMTVKPLTSRNGATGLEMTLTRVSESSETNDEEECVTPMKRTVEGTKGPVYAIDISTERMTRILYIDADSPDAKVKEIVSWIRTFKVDPGPKPVCIQDLGR